MERVDLLGLGGGDLITNYQVRESGLNFPSRYGFPRPSPCAGRHHSSSVPTSIYSWSDFDLVEAFPLSLSLAVAESLSSGHGL